jgi:hypothetical protein
MQKYTAMILKLFLGLLIFSAPALALAQPVPQSPPSPTFQLTLLLTEEEVSKDSSTDEYYISIIDRHVKYQWRHTGFPDEMHEAFAYDLSEKTLQSLVNYIQQHQLNQNLKEIKPADKLGFSVSLNLEITLNYKTTKASLCGMTNCWEDKHTTNLNHLAYANKIQDIITGIKNKNSTF